jgi:hypothetical protein
VEVSALAAFLGELARFSSEAQRRNIEGFERLFREFGPLYERLTTRRRQFAERFNVFSALRVERRELAHSAFLAYLLDPVAHHDQGARMLKSFLAHLNIGVGSATDLERAKVVSEHAVGELGRLDITISFPNGVIVAIENKVDAREQEQQVARYQEWLATERRLPHGSHTLIFLTPDGRRPSNESATAGIEVRCCSYQDIARWLLAMTDLPARLATVVKMYADVCVQIGSGR